MFAELEELGKLARQVARQLRTLDTNVKDDALRAIAETIEENEFDILSANSKDIEAGRAAGLDEHILERLLLTESRLASIADDVRSVAALPDPVGESFDARTLSNGLRISKRRVPIGVIGVIYESRPNVTVDIAALCLKSGNAAILRGGKEAVNSNLALSDTISAGCEKVGISKEKKIKRRSHLLAYEFHFCITRLLLQYIQTTLPPSMSGSSVLPHVIHLPRSFLFSLCCLLLALCCSLFLLYHSRFCCLFFERQRPQ